ncbi:class I SAM-dependent methyltransferase [Clostridium estertheticum]|uniref:class I SAM-dependent methyltransferase n=1 Tax=Clostridium estertheticum TaxID=238834 RepID=UPI001C7CDF8E|nr:class I SAM-dependent methyltransferase [Clostridium estertheticum]MBX4269652.1 class I SAM-dependent methyltransferase [Clostridium estertheticum]WLC79472.1 class I SAM-dependent methyltransferase [Clostridium estertheticum]
MNNIVNFYNTYDEESRVSTNKARKVEFNVTTSILDEYIKHQDKIIELGAGTGVYSFYYANKGNEVMATDITPKHVEIIKQKLSKVSNTIKLQAEVANAIDLKQYDSESFDVVLCLGPMYHLINEKDRESCISENLRILKKGGILAIAYINKHYVLNSIMSQDKNFLTHGFIDKILSGGTIEEGEKECFWTDAFFTTPTDMELLVSKFNTKIIDHAATDGISPLLGKLVDEMNDEEYEAWIYYNLCSCREKSILGSSNHALLICRK